ncbi:MAG: hypothetical protein K9M96_06395 [Deltaproteobacteria bacterium]|nr:hypothetical protein [Deltaproteobacteria bacterium]
MRKTFLLVTFLFFCGCSAHSAWITKDTTDTAPITETAYPAHNNKVFVTENSIKEGQFTPVARIDIGKVWYGSTDNVLESMAIRAREIGADAVIDVKTWRQPSGWSWAAPHGSGLAVKMKDNDLDFSGLSGKWL